MNKIGHDVASRAQPLGEPLGLLPARGVGLVFLRALYNYQAGIAVPVSGQLTHDAAAGVMRISETAANGAAIGARLALLGVGDTITIYSTTYTITGGVDQGSYWQVTVAPLVSAGANGQVPVTFRAAP